MPKCPLDEYNITWICCLLAYKQAPIKSKLFGTKQRIPQVKRVESTSEANGKREGACGHCFWCAILPLGDYMCLLQISQEIICLSNLMFLPTPMYMYHLFITLYHTQVLQNGEIQSRQECIAVSARSYWIYLKHKEWPWFQFLTGKNWKTWHPKLQSDKIADKPAGLPRFVDEWVKSPHSLACQGISLAIWDDWGLLVVVPFPHKWVL